MRNITIKCVRCGKTKDTLSFDDDNNTCRVCCKYGITRYQEKINNGLCGSCGENTTIDNKKTCESCLTRSRKYEKKKRESALANNKCRACNKEAPVPGYSKCEYCRNRDKLPTTTKLFRSARSRAKKSNIEFTIQESDIILVDTCPVLGIKLKQNKKIGKENSYSLDRIDNKKGYIPENIHVISMRANQIKNDSTIEELEKLIAYLKKLK